MTRIPQILQTFSKFIQRIHSTIYSTDSNEFTISTLIQYLLVKDINLPSSGNSDSGYYFYLISSSDNNKLIANALYYQDNDLQYESVELEISTLSLIDHVFAI